MARLMDPVVSEFKEEVAITRRCLDRVPEDKLGWKPHPKSMTLGQLAWHVATIPGGLARLLEQDGFDVTQGNFVPPQPPKREGNSRCVRRERARWRSIFAGRHRREAESKLAADEQRSATILEAARRGAAYHHAESLVSPSRAAVGVLEDARRSCAGDLRAQRGRESVRLVHIAERAGAGAAGIAAGSAGTSRSGRSCAAFGRHREHRKLRFELGRVALRAFGFFLAVDERLELVVTLLADVFVNRHLCRTPQKRITTKDTKVHEGFQSKAFSFVRLRVLRGSRFHSIRISLWTVPKSQISKAQLPGIKIEAFARLRLIRMRSSRGGGCGAGMSRLSPAFCSRGGFICLRRKSGWWRLRRGSRCGAGAVGRRIAWRR